MAIKMVEKLEVVEQNVMQTKRKAMVIQRTAKDVVEKELKIEMVASAETGKIGV